jgi:hypothetical protein
LIENLKGPKDHSNRGDWWHVDSQERKIGYLWPEDMRAVLESIWGRRQGIKNFARYAGLNITTVEKYCNGKVPVPKHIALLVLNMQELFLERGAHLKAHPWRSIPTVDAPWLPEERQDEKFTVPTKPFG